MFLKKIAKKTKEAIVASEMHSGFAKFCIVNAYKFALILMGKLNSRKKSAYKIIEESIAPEKFEDKHYVCLLYTSRCV